MKTFIVYKITNKKNGKSYIGKTEYSLEHRWNRHLSSARNGSKFRFHSAIRKYGEDCWDLSIVESYQTDDENFINEKETHFIKLFESDVKGYNATSGGTGGWMLPRCSQEVQEEWKNNISRRTIGHNNPNYSGYTDEQLIEIGVKFAKKYGFIGGRKRIVEFALNELNIKFPKHFSKNRFGGNHKNFYQCIEEQTGLVYNPYYRDEAQRKLAKQLLEQNRKRNAKD